LKEQEDAGALGIQGQLEQQKQRLVTLEIELNVEFILIGLKLQDDLGVARWGCSYDIWNGVVPVPEGQVPIKPSEEALDKFATANTNFECFLEQLEAFLVFN
jgi:hypothetical protein